MSDLISRRAAIEAINKAFARVFECDGTEPLGEKVLKDVPSAQPDLLDGLKIIEQFLQSCKDSLTCEIIAPNGMKLHTDWGYFVEGLEELRRYAERRTDEAD